MATVIGEEFTLIDGENNKEFSIILSKEDATRARNGKYMVFI